MSDEQPYVPRNVFSSEFIPPVPKFEAPWGDGSRPEQTRRVPLLGIVGAPNVPVAPLAPELSQTPTEVIAARTLVHQAIDTASQRP